MAKTANPLLPKNADGSVGYVNTNRDDPAFGQPIYQDQYGGFTYTQPGAAGRSETQVLMSRWDGIPKFLSTTAPDINSAQLTGNTAAKEVDITGGMASGVSTLPSAPQPSTIGNPITPPTTTSLPTPTFPMPNAGSTNNQQQQSVAAQTQATKDALQAEADKRVAEYDTKIATLEQKELELQQLQDAGMLDLKEATMKEGAEKRAELDLERQRFDENYNASQQLIGELDGLLMRGQAAITEMENTTGLASIMNPRIAKTAQETAARAGVIQAVLSARSNQMSQAQNQLQAATNAISSIYSDELDYYKTVVNYYGTLKDENNNKILNLTEDQRAYADMKISLLENDLNQLNATKAHIEEAMLDPDTALMYAKAGVTLNDSVEGINRKIATYQYQQEVVNISNQMSLQGYTSVPQPGATPVQIIDSQGTVRTYYQKPGATAAGDDGFTLSAGQTRYNAAGNPVASAPEKTSPTENEAAKLLTPAEVKSLNEQGYTKVVYGMTREQAMATAPKPAASGYPTTNLQPGATGAQVQQLQTWLVANGYMTQADMNTGPGVYGPKTTAAVAKLQADKGVDNTGAVGYYGPKTIAALQGQIAPKTTTSSGGSSGGSTSTKDYAFASASDKSKVLTWVAANPSAGVDMNKLKTDQNYFYWVLSKASAGSGRSE